MTDVLINDALSVLGYNYDGTFGNVTLTSTGAGYVRIHPSSAADMNGGPVQLMSGDGVSDGANGGDIIAQGGAGVGGGNGGQIHLYAGAGGTDGAGNDGNGGDIRLSPGPGSGGTSRNGLVVLDTAMLPTADPHVDGALWNNGGVLTVSAG